MTEKDDKVIPAGVAAAMLEATRPVDPGSVSAARMKARLLERVGGEAPEAATSDDILTVTTDTGEWIETGPGNSIKVLRDDSETMSMLVRLSPGATFPEHYHPADEETYVIEGETWFGDIHLGAGDYHHAAKGTTHGEVRTETGCVLLIRKASE